MGKKFKGHDSSKGSSLLALEDRRTPRLSVLRGNPVSVPLLSFFGNQKIQKDITWMPYLLKLRPKWGWRQTLFQVTGRRQLIVTRPFYVQVLGRLPKSWSWDPDSSCPESSPSGTAMAKVFPGFWELLSILPLSLFIFLKRLQSWFLVSQQRP